MSYLSTFLIGFLLVRFSVQNEDPKYRLPSEVIPLNYDLKLRPFIHEDYFVGEVFIRVNVLAPVKQIYLHGSGLNITEVQISDADPEDELKFELEPFYELIRIYYQNGTVFDVGMRTLHFKYFGSLVHSDQMGMVKSTYQAHHKTEYLVVTDFQPTYARRAFPCFDEPSLKAIYNVSIVVPHNSSYRALSNGELIGKEETPEGVVYRFEATPPMSSELTSFAVTKMDFKDFRYNINGRPLTIRTFLGNAREENMTLVPDFTGKTIRYFENFTGVAYPMSKIDFIEYDKKFAATEYWGLTTFKKGLLNPTIDEYDTRQITIILAHEISHYWFGNLVTNKWWSDIWLQEGFSQYLSIKVVDYIMNMTNVEEYPLDYSIGVLHVDRESKDVNPIVINCSTPVEIMVQFNDITYSKSGSILRLMDFIIGYKLFSEIIQAYFQRFQFKSAGTEDFIGLVEEKAHEDGQILRDYLETWLYQNRYPLITITEDDENKNYVLTQTSASMHKDTDHLSQFGYKWTVPILYTTNTNKNPTLVWFKKDMNKLIIPRGNETFIKLNYNFMGIYYTNYTTAMWENLTENFQFLSSLEQVQLITEAGGLFYSDIINCDIPLKLTAKSSIEKKGLYSATHLSFLYSLKGDFKDEKPTLDLLRKFYISIKTKSDLRRRRDQDRSRSSVPESNSTPRSKRKAKMFKQKANSKENDVLGSSDQKMTERLAKCSKWIHENLKYLT